MAGGLVLRQNIPDDGQRNDVARNDCTLQHPESKEHPDIVGQRAGERCERENRETGKQHGAPAVPVRQWSHDQLQECGQPEIAGD